MFQFLVDRAGLSDRDLGSDMSKGFPMAEVPTGYWALRENTPAQKSVMMEKQHEKGEKGKMVYPPKEKKVRAENVKKYFKMKEIIASDVGRGRYVMLSRKEYEDQRKVAEDNGFELPIVQLNPIDQSQLNDALEMVEKFRVLWDGRYPNRDWENHQKMRLFNNRAIQEAVYMYLAEDPNEQFGQPTTQKKKDTYEAMMREVKIRKDFDAKNNDYLMRRRVYEDQIIKDGIIQAEVASGSMEELCKTVIAVQAALEETNEKLRILKIGIKSRRRLVIFTRDFKGAYYQFAIRDPNDNWFSFWEPYGREPDWDKCINLSTKQRKKLRKDKKRRKVHQDVQTAAFDNKSLFEGQWRFGKSNVLNMGALPAIFSFLRVRV